MLKMTMYELALCLNYLLVVPQAHFHMHGFFADQVFLLLSTTCLHDLINVL